MPNYAEYFERERYKPRYQIGDRVSGRWNKIPFIGSVGNDRYINDISGPEVTIHLDLPIQLAETTHRVIIVKHKDIKPLVNYDDDSGLQRRSKTK